MVATQCYDDILKSPVGYLGVKFTGDDLSSLDFLGKTVLKEKVINNNNNKLINKLKVILDAYFQNPHGIKKPQTSLAGTNFQKKVWRVLASIHPGETRTYGDIAKELKTSPRAVGNACRKNPVPIFIPCHRVVSLSGRGGFMGHTSGEPIAIKEWLLAHEQKAPFGE